MILLGIRTEASNSPPLNFLLCENNSPHLLEPRRLGFLFLVAKCFLTDIETWEKANILSHCSP